MIAMDAAQTDTDAIYLRDGQSFLVLAPCEVTVEKDSGGARYRITRRKVDSDRLIPLAKPKPNTVE